MVVRHIAYPDGYISASGQEVCLMLYGGSALASALDRLSDEFRSALAPPAPAVPACRRLTFMYGDLSAGDAPEISVGHAEEREHTAAPEPARTTQAPVAEHPSPGRADSEAGTVGEAPPAGSPAPACMATSRLGLARHHRPRRGIPRTIADHPHGAPISDSRGAQVPDPLPQRFANRLSATGWDCPRSGVEALAERVRLRANARLSCARARTAVPGAKPSQRLRWLLVLMRLSRHYRIPRTRVVCAWPARRAGDSSTTAGGGGILGIFPGRHLPCAGQPPACPLMKRPQPAAQRWGPWHRLDILSCRRKRPRKNKKKKKKKKSSRHRRAPATSWMLSLPPLSARPGLLQTLAKRVYIMPAAAPRHQAFASSARKFGTATSFPQSAGLLLWACRSATRSSYGRAPATTWRRSAGCWPNCPGSRTCCDIAFLPASLGERLSPAAYWAAWADALPVLQQGAQRRLSVVCKSSRPAARPRRQAPRLPRLQACTLRRLGSVSTNSGAASGASRARRVGKWLAKRYCSRTPHFFPRAGSAAGHSAQRPCAAAFPSKSKCRAWLVAIPADPATILAPDIMHLAFRRRIRLPLPLTRARCGGKERQAAVALVDNLGDHALACPRAGLLARRGFVLERAWIEVVREAIGPEGKVVPQQWLANTTAPGVAADDRRRFDFVIYGAAARGEALCCDATLVSPVRRDGSPQAGAPERDGVAIATAQRRKLAHYPELTRGGPHRLCVLAAEVGGRWNDESQRLVQRLVALRMRHAPATLRAAASQGWAGRWWGALAVAVQRATCSAVLGVWTLPSLPAAESDVPLAEVLPFAADTAPSRLPMR